MSRAVLATVLLAASVALAGCSDDESSDGVGGPTGRPPSTVDTEGGAGQAIDDGAVPDGATSSVVAISTVSSPMTWAVSSTTDGSGATASTSGGPTTTAERTNDPARPGGCLDAPPGAAVELTVDDDGVGLLGSEAPACLRVRSSQRIHVTSRAGFGTAVSIGATTLWLAPGGELTSAPLSERYAVGSIVDVRIDVLAVTVTVQVVP